jgi:predicted dehydrogenase
MTFTFEGGAVGTLIGGWRDRQSRTIELMEIGGTGGYVQVEDVQNEVRHFKLDADRFETFRPNYFAGDDTRFYDSLTAHVHDFLKRVQANVPPLVIAADGVRGLEIAAAAIESHDSGELVAV